MLHFGPDGKPVGEADAVLSRLAFYRDDYALILDEDAKPIGFRADFMRDRSHFGGSEGSS
jgi:hypothetical protein